MDAVALNEFLGTFFAIRQYEQGEQGGFFRHSNRLLSHCALALEPSPDLYAHLKAHPPDVLWLHRPWKLNLAAVPPSLPILYHHLPFDETLTLGFNRPLAAALAFHAFQELGYKQAENGPRRPIGMLASVPDDSAERWRERLAREFGGLEMWLEPTEETVRGVAVVGAMNENLVREAAERGANLYVTGQFRPSARRAVQETGMGVAEVGHQRSEVWGLRALADVIRTEFPALSITVF